MVRSCTKEIMFTDLFYFRGLNIVTLDSRCSCISEINYYDVDPKYILTSFHLILIFLCYFQTLETLLRIERSVSMFLKLQLVHNRQFISRI